MNKQRNELWLTLTVMVLGIGLSFAGEVNLDLWWAPALGFAILRAYVVSHGHIVRVRLGEEGKKIARNWTFAAGGLASAYIFSLVLSPEKGGHGLAWSTIIALQAGNIMLIGVEIYYSIGAPEHPAEVARKALVEQIENLQMEYSKKSEASELKIETLESQIGQLRIANRNSKEASESKIGQLKSQIEQLRIANRDTQTQADFNTTVISEHEEKLRIAKKEKSELIRRVSIVAQKGNYKACGCPKCATVNIWGIAKKEVVCSSCGYTILKR